MLYWRNWENIVNKNSKYAVKCMNNALQSICGAPDMWQTGVLQAFEEQHIKRKILEGTKIRQTKNIYNMDGGMQIHTSHLPLF